MAARTRPGLCAVAQSPANAEEQHSREGRKESRFPRGDKELCLALGLSRSQLADVRRHRILRSYLASCKKNRRRVENGEPLNYETGVRDSGLPVGKLPRTRKQVASYRHPRTGQKRKQRKPLRIDRLSRGVKDAIIAARASGEAWGRVAEMASAAAGQNLSRTSVQRWYDLRIEQQSIGAALREIIELLKPILKAVQP